MFSAAFVRFPALRQLYIWPSRSPISDWRHSELPISSSIKFPAHYGAVAFPTDLDDLSTYAIRRKPVDESFALIPFPDAFLLDGTEFDENVFRCIDIYGIYRGGPFPREQPKIFLPATREVPVEVPVLVGAEVDIPKHVMKALAIIVPVLLDIRAKLAKVLLVEDYLSKL